MSTFTSRLNLEKPDKSESMKLGDNILSANYQKIDAATGCTLNAVAPVAPFNGQLWSAGSPDYQTSFFKSSWNPIGKKGFQRGFSAYDLDATIRQFESGFSWFPYFIQFDAVLGRLYEINWSVFFKWRQPGRGLIQFEFEDQNPGNFQNLAVQRYEWYSPTKSLGQSISGFFEWTPDVSRSVHLSFVVNTSLAAGLTTEINTFNAISNILVEDIGAA